MVVVRGPRPAAHRSHLRSGVAHDTQGACACRQLWNCAQGSLTLGCGLWAAGTPQ